MKKTRFKELLAVGLGNIVSGIFFGTGCIMIEHADNLWIHPEIAEDDGVAESKTTARRQRKPSEAKTTATSQPTSAEADEQLASSD